MTGEPTAGEGVAHRVDQWEAAPARKRPRIEPGPGSGSGSGPREGHDANEGPSDPPPPNQHLQRPSVEFEVFCREEQPAKLEILLLDEQGQPLGEAAAAEFVVTCPTLSVDGGSGGGQAVHLLGSGGRLNLAFVPPRAPRDNTHPAGTGGAATAVPELDLDLDPAKRVVQEHRVVLEPTGPSYTHVLPLVLVVKVQVMMMGCYSLANMSWVGVWR